MYVRSPSPVNACMILLACYHTYIMPLNLPIMHNYFEAFPKVFNIRMLQNLKMHAYKVAL